MMDLFLACLIDELSDVPDVHARLIQALEMIGKDQAPPTRGVAFRFFIGANNKLSWTSLNGGDKKRILEHLNFDHLFAGWEPERAKFWKELFRIRKFGEMYHQFHDVSDAGRWTADLWDQKAQEFGRFFTKEAVIKKKNSLGKLDDPMRGFPKTAPTPYVSLL